MVYSDRILIKVYDEKSYLDNVMVPLSLKVKEVIYFYRAEPDKKRKEAIIAIFSKNKIKATFIKVVKDEEIDPYLLKYTNAIIDVSSRKYLILYIFERIIKSDNMIVYYDNEENVIKDYRHHKRLDICIYRLNIKEIVNLSGADFRYNMHESPDINDKEFVNRFKDIIYAFKDRYSTLTNFISFMISLMTYEKDDKITLKSKNKERLRSSEVFRYFKDEHILDMKGDVLFIKDKRFKKLFYNAGAWLETYLYIMIIESGLFDECAMSAIIEFKDSDIHYPITCEIDLIALKDNHLLFVSCKSNKVDAYAVNEIRLHNYVFGNELSKAMVCTFEDLNVKNPTIYEKAKELEVAVIDYPNIVSKDLGGLILDVIKEGYRYEKVRINK